MIELTPEQSQSLRQIKGRPPTLIDPTTQIAYVLLRKDEYEKMMMEDGDNGAWTDEELDQLAAEVDAIQENDPVHGLRPPSTGSAHEPTVG